MYYTRVIWVVRATRWIYITREIGLSIISELISQRYINIERDPNGGQSIRREFSHDLENTSGEKLRAAVHPLTRSDC